MNKTNRKSIDKAALVIVKKVNMGGSYSICRESHRKEAKEKNHFKQFTEIGFVEVCQQCDT